MHMNSGQRVPALAVRFWMAVTVLLFLTFISVPGSAQQSWHCPLRVPDRSVTICRPVTGVTYDSPVRVLAGASHSQPIQFMQVYLDGSKVHQASGDVADTNLILTPGAHHLTVQAIDALGSFKQSMDLVIHSRPYPRFAYLANSNDQTLSMFSIEAASGFVRQNGYVLAGDKPSGVAETWRGYVYAAGGTSGKLYAYRKAYGGRLTSVPGSPYSCGTDCRAVAVDALGNFVFSVDYATNTIRGFKINATTGALTPILGSPFSSGDKPNSVVINVRGILFVTNESSNTVSAFVIDPVSGALTPTPGSPIATGLSPRSAAVDPFGGRLYVLNYGSNTISAFRVTSNGTMSNLGSPVKTGSGPSSITVYPSGAFLYIAQAQSNTVSAFKLDIDGALHAIGTVASGPKPMAVRVDAQGKYALVANSGAPYELWVYKIDMTTGALTFVRGTRTRGSGIALAVSSGAAPLSIEPGFLYAGTADKSNYSGKVFGFAINSAGALSAVAGSPFAHPKGTTALAAHPTGAMLYAPGLKLPDQYGGIVAQYWVNRSTGALTQAAPYQHFEEFESYCMAVDPSGRFAYATSGNGVFEPWFTGWSVSASGGPLGGWLFYPGGIPWQYIGLDPTGKYAYRDNETLGIDALSGELFYEKYPEDSFGKISVDPTGRFAYGLGTDQIMSYSVSGSTGILKQVGTAVATGSGPVLIAVDPYGRFVYVANKNSNNVSAYKANLGNGTLTPIGSHPYAAGTGPIAITIDVTGKYLYVLNEASLDITAYRIAQSTGALTVLTGSPFRLLAPGMATSLTTIGKTN